jgi:hypothetical protein
MSKEPKIPDSRPKTGNRRGQVFSSDLIFAVAIVLILIAVVWQTWGDMDYDMGRRLQVNEMKQAALGIGDALVMTPGSPHNWSLDSVNATSVGLASTPRIISEDKWNALSGMPYETQRGKIGAGRFDFWLALRTPGGSVINSTGLEPAGDYQIGIVRPVVYRGEAAVLNLVLWGDYYIGYLNRLDYRTL